MGDGEVGLKVFDNHLKQIENVLKQKINKNDDYNLYVFCNYIINPSKRIAINI
jgi:hypothetical protein